MSQIIYDLDFVPLSVILLFTRDHKKITKFKKYFIFWNWIKIWVFVVAKYFY